jgi:ABC-type antimicrobial peptide transport system permease subunit
VVSIPEDNPNSKDKSYLDDYSDSSKQLIKEMLFNAYDTEWQRTRDIEQKASSSIGFVGIILTLTIATLSTILVNSKDITREQIFFSSIFSSIGIALILFLMGLSIYYGVKTISVKNWKFPSASKLLDHCKEKKTDDEILEIMFENYTKIITLNSNLNDEISKYLRYSHYLFMASLASLIVFILMIIDSFS